MSDTANPKPAEAAVHCHACSKFISVPENAGEGDLVKCPFCMSETRLALMTVWVGYPPAEDA